MTRIAALAVLAALAAVSPAWAQIYSWQDASGAQVYSDRPRPGSGEMVTFAVAGRPDVRATKPAVPRASGRFDDIIERHAGDSGVPADLVRAVIQVESGFNPAAVSPKGAQGLMQLMPGTARELGVADPFQPEDNIRGGVTYLKRLLEQYSHDVRLALAAYNAGPASVDRYGDVPPYRETQAYVKKIASATSITVPTPARPVKNAAPAIYRWVEMVDGRPIPRYSNVPPAGGTFEIIGRR
jgi:soluble lytic murein transglycosylase-like protein